MSKGLDKEQKRLKKEQKRFDKEQKQMLKDVNGIANHTASAIVTTHSTTFAIFYIIEIVLDYYVYPLLPDGFWRTILMAIIGAILYTVVYFCIKKGYNRYIDSKKPKFDIEGVWYHVHIPHNMGAEDYNSKNVRAGTTLIARDLYDFTFVGENKGYVVDDNGSVCCINDHTTSWCTEVSEISDSREFDIIQVYKANSTAVAKKEIKECPCCREKFPSPVEINLADKFRYGVHKFKINKTHDRIDGTYSDCWPSLKTGELILYRSQTERDERIKLFFQRRSEALNLQKSKSEQPEEVGVK